MTGDFSLWQYYGALNESTADELAHVMELRRAARNEQPRDRAQRIAAALSE